MDQGGQTDRYLAAAKDGGWLESGLCPDVGGSAYFCTCLPVTVEQQQKGQGAATAPAVQHIALWDGKISWWFIHRILRTWLRMWHCLNVGSSSCLLQQSRFFMWLFRVVPHWHLEN